MQIRLSNGKTKVVSSRTETTLLDSEGNRTGAVSDNKGNLYTVSGRDAEGCLWEKEA